VFEPLWDETERLIHHTGLMRSRAADLRHDHAALIRALATGRAEEAAAAIETRLERLHRVIVEWRCGRRACWRRPRRRRDGAGRDDRDRGLRKTGRQSREIKP
jgi:hypothetical protein